MLRRAYVLILPMVFAAVTAEADVPQAAVPALRDWIAIAPFDAQSREMHCANHGTGGEWTVAAAGAEIQVRPFTDPPAPALGFTLPREASFERPSSSLAVTDGVLVGFDHGEWGGGLTWFSRDGASKYWIITSNVQALVARGRDATAFGGLEHLGLSEGKVFELAAPRKGARWQVTRTLDLGAAPEAVAADPRGGFLVVTTQGLSRYARGRVDPVHASMYSVLYPNSVVVTPDGTVYIGMRHAVARLTPKGRGYTEHWLVQPACRGLTITAGPRLTCECRPTE